MLIMTVLEKRSSPTRPKAAIKLTRMESIIYGVLWERRGEVVPLSDFLDVMDGANEPTMHTSYNLAVYICRLRRKLKGVLDIGTYPKKGYSINK